MHSHTSSPSDSSFDQAARLIAGARRIAVLTGAGISVESGIPPFRGPGGVWERFDPMEFATIEAFLGDPAKVWRVLLSELKGLIDNARPNAAHRALAHLEALGKEAVVITQNVDGLHQAAGSSEVVEFHGTFARQHCLSCGEELPTSAVALETIPPRCACGGILRPACVFFGEDIPPKALQRSHQVAARCEVMLVVGTSAMVQPAASMPIIARRGGASVIEINMEPTPLTGCVSHLLLQGSASAVMQRLVAAVHAHGTRDATA